MARKSGKPCPIPRLVFGKNLSNVKKEETKEISTNSLSGKSGRGNLIPGCLREQHSNREQRTLSHQ